MILLKKLVETAAPSMEFYVYNQEEEKLSYLGRASTLARWLEEDGFDGLVPYFTAGQNRLNIYLQKIEREVE